MKQIVSVIVAVLFSLCSYSQVGIGTTSPSSAAVLHLKTANSGLVKVGGFLVPVVTETQQALIPVKESDDGLMVFVKDVATGKRCLEIYDGKLNVWRNIKCT